MLEKLARYHREALVSVIELFTLFYTSFRTRSHHDPYQSYGGQAATP
jgi:hypothetical protein